MARAHFVKAARKAYPDHGIAKGQSYWWWKFRRGSKQFSLTQPKPSQLTQSEFLSGAYRVEETLSASRDEVGEALADTLDSLAEEVRELGEGCDERRGNMPDALQESEAGELLQTRMDSCEDFAGDLEDAAQQVRDRWGEFIEEWGADKEPEDTDGKEAFQAAREEAVNDCRGVVDELSWDFE